MGNDITNAEALFAVTHGPVATNFAIFASLYSAFMGHLAGAVNAVSSGLAGSMTTTVTIGIVTMLMLWACVYALRHPSDNVLADAVTRVLVPGAVALYILRGNYQADIAEPLINQATTWGNAMVAGVGGASIAGGSIFDTLWNHAYEAGVSAWAHVPDWPLSEAIGCYILIVLYWAAVIVSIGFAFGLFMLSQVTLDVLLAIGPIFIGLGAFQPTRFLLKGMVSAVASVICAQVIILALLAIAYIVEQSVLAPVWTPGGGAAQPANENIYGIMQTLLGVGATLTFCTFCAWKTSAYAVGICGGIFDGIAPWLAAGAAAMKGGGRAAAYGKRKLTGGSTASGTASRRINTAGRLGGVTP